MDQKIGKRLKISSCLLHYAFLFIVVFQKMMGDRLIDANIAFTSSDWQISFD
jgi:hypothetical protein